jgi:hypothetical protein
MGLLDAEEKAAITAFTDMMTAAHKHRRDISCLSQSNLPQLTYLSGPQLMDLIASSLPTPSWWANRPMLLVRDATTRKFPYHIKSPGYDAAKANGVELAAAAKAAAEAAAAKAKAEAEAAAAKAKAEELRVRDEMEAKNPALKYQRLQLEEMRQLREEVKKDAAAHRASEQAAARASAASAQRASQAQTAANVRTAVNVGLTIARAFI